MAPIHKYRYSNWPVIWALSMGFTNSFLVAFLILRIPLNVEPVSVWLKKIKKKKKIPPSQNLLARI